MTVLGADWGRGVYVVARLDPATLDLDLSPAPDAAALLAMETDLLAVDMPIGLPEGPPEDAGVRPCDAAARRLIPGRSSSVFNVPLRSVVGIATYPDANARYRERTGKGLTPQSFGFMRHVAEMDAALRTADEAIRERTWEIHPEASFAALSGGATLRAGKRTDEGARLRREALAAWLGEARVERALGALPRSLTAPDDVLDALAAAWSASRIARGEHRTVTDGIPRDAEGLRMTIAY